MGHQHHVTSDNVHGSHVTEKDESCDSHVTERSEEGGRVVTPGLRLRDRTVITPQTQSRLASFPCLPTIQFLTFAYFQKLDGGKAWERG